MSNRNLINNTRDKIDGIDVSINTNTLVDNQILVYDLSTNEFKNQDETYISGENIYNRDDSLSGDRVVTLGDRSLDFFGNNDTRILLNPVGRDIDITASSVRVINSDTFVANTNTAAQLNSASVSLSGSSSLQMTGPASQISDIPAYAGLDIQTTNPMLVNNKIKSSNVPTDNDDLTNKLYVDSHVASNTIYSSDGSLSSNRILNGLSVYSLNLSNLTNLTLGTSTVNVLSTTTFNDGFNFLSFAGAPGMTLSTNVFTVNGAENLFNVGTMTLQNGCNITNSAGTSDILFNQTYLRISHPTDIRVEGPTSFDGVVELTAQAGSNEELAKFTTTGRVERTPNRIAYCVARIAGNYNPSTSGSEQRETVSGFSSLVPVELGSASFTTFDSNSSNLVLNSSLPLRVEYDGSPTVVAKVVCMVSWNFDIVEPNLFWATFKNGVNLGTMIRTQYTATGAYRTDTWENYVSLSTGDYLSVYFINGLAGGTLTIQSLSLSVQIERIDALT